MSTYPIREEPKGGVFTSDECSVSDDWSPDLDPDDLRELQAAQQDQSKVISEMPQEAVLLGYFSTICLVLNRMIGIGIFSSAGVVFFNTQSIGLSLVMWMLGSIMCIAGQFVFVELGSTIPRWPYGGGGDKISAMRSGDGLNYFNYMLKKPLFFATCMYGITFTLFENVAANCVAFAGDALDAAHINQNPTNVVIVTLAANTICCLLHAFSRKWGVLMNNFFGVTKLLILVFVALIGFIWVDRSVADKNFDLATSFDFTHSPTGPFRYAEAMLNIILPFGAFHQVNYVIAEARNPRKVFPRASSIGVGIVIAIYMIVNVMYAAIIPKATLFKKGQGMLGIYFTATIGQVMTDPLQLKTFCSILKAISAFGNLIVVTFTTARVKQEIAKEGIYPYSLFFSESTDLSFSRLLGRKLVPNKKGLHHEKTPAPTVLLHWVITTVIVLASCLALRPHPYSSGVAYAYVNSAFIYDVNVVYFVLVAFGLLCLRFTPRVRWSQKSSMPAWISITAASVFMICNMFPLIFLWVPDPKFPQATESSVPWYAGSSLALCLLSFSFFYWVVFRLYIKIRSDRGGQTLYVNREPIFKHDKGGLTQIYEIVTLQWVKDVGLGFDQMNDADIVQKPQDSISPTTDRSGRQSQTQEDAWEVAIQRSERHWQEHPSQEQLDRPASTRISSRRNSSLNVSPPDVFGRHSVTEGWKSHDSLAPATDEEAELKRWHKDAWEDLRELVVDFLLDTYSRFLLE